MKIRDKKIPRGRIYHSVLQDLSNLFRAFYTDLKDSKIIIEFESLFSNLIKRNYCITFPFARTAFYYALKVKNFPPGSEIIFPPVTIKAMLDVALSLELVPVFVDLDLNTLCFDEDQLRLSVTDKTRAILVTYLFGIVPNINNIITLLEKNNIFIIEDFSQCLNGEWGNKKIGSFGDIGIYSSSSTKQLDLYGGGILVCDDIDIAKSLKTYQSELKNPSRLHLISKIWTDLTRNLATSYPFFNLITFWLIALMSKINVNKTIKYVGDRNKNPIESLPGIWFEKFTSFQAKFGILEIEGLSKTDFSRISYANLVKNTTNNFLNFPNGDRRATNVYWQLVTFIDNAIDSQKKLRDHGIDSSTTSLLVISNLENYPYKKITPNAIKLHDCGLLIPCFPQIANKQIDHILKVLSICFEKK